MHAIKSRVEKQMAAAGAAAGRGGREGSRRLVSVVKAIAQSGKASADDDGGCDGDDDEYQHEIEL